MNKSRKTNTLDSHHPERTSKRADKMGVVKGDTKYSRKFLKKFMSKKRRQLLKQNTESKI